MQVNACAEISNNRGARRVTVKVAMRVAARGREGGQGGGGHAPGHTCPIVRALLGVREDVKREVTRQQPICNDTGLIIPFFSRFHPNSAARS